MSLGQAPHTVTQRVPRAGNFALPALRSLGKLVGTEPVVVIDSREQNPLPFSRLKTQAGSLITGDYSLVGAESLFSVERKTLDDLAACCMSENRKRFERELHRLRGFRFKRLLIVGSEEQIWRCQYHSSIAPKAILATLAAFEVRYDCPVVFRPTPEAAARQIESWAFWYAREMIETVNNLWRGVEAGHRTN